MDNLDSWSIPKRKPSAAPQERSSTLPSRPMDMAIPKKKKAAPARENSPTMTMNMAIPRRQTSGGNGHGKAQNFHKPRDKGHSRPSFDPAEALVSMHRGQVPRKKQSLPMAARTPRGGVQVASEFPFILKVPLKGVPLHEGIPKSRASSRTPKRKRKSYKELDDTDSDDILTDSDEEVAKKSLKKKKSKVRVSTAPAPTGTSSTASSVPTPVTARDTTSTELLGLNNSSMEAPPSGTLSTLWYSRECFSHVHAVEKLLAWKTRAVTQLEWIPESLPEDHPHNTPTVDVTDAAKWSTMALADSMVWSDPNKRMEVSRLVPEKCPIVVAMACTAQPEEGPRFRIKPLSEKDREEVYLVKWRGRSHLHASWERGSDIIKYDQSNNTARHKIRRFVQSQEIAFGKQWKQVLEGERTTTANIHAHGEHTTAADTDAVEEEYFPPAVLEIERVLACDESEMDLDLFARQRALNIKAEQELVQEKESDNVRKWNSTEGLKNMLVEVPWDPEDNVRYVVKWKGLPFAEMTWEYWRDIKRDATDEAEDFWTRQKPPPPDQVQELLHKSHPHIREFRKIQESPVFGMSTARKIADMGQNKEEDDGENNPSLRLRSYQLEGVNWLLFNWWNHRSCILADEMGLGKTIQSMCFLKTLQDLPTTQVRGPFLIVAPLSLIAQWQSEARTWAPDLNVVLYHGSADARDFLVKQDFFYTDQFVPKPTAAKLKKQHLTKFHILITTYEVVLKDVSVFSKIRWRALIVDEAHRLKNPKSKLFEELATVPRDFCLLLTGTPLANATEELWALLHFADKNAFADKDDFLGKFGQLTDADQVNELHSILKPYLLRRVKEDVEKSLPPKEETILEVALTPIQKKYYKAIYERNTAFLYKGSKPSNAPSLMNVMMELRKCCNHPYLVRGAEERILADAANQIKTANGEETKDTTLDYTKLFGDQLIKSSGKMVLINKLLPKLFSNGHKVLIFSQMVRVLDLLEELLKVMKYKYERLDGSTSSSSRTAAVDRFCRKSCQRFVMLLSTRAGGLGLNLTAADIVVIFDSDWNPQNDLQAMARAHRIGQTRSVRVYRLLTAKTYEMHMFHSASMKLGLERAVLSQQREQGEDGENGKSKNVSEKEAQAKEIDSLLKKGAYDVFRDDDDAEARKFMETDIDQLLESNAQTVTYSSTGESNQNSGLGSFSKASFVADTGDGEKDVDLDDPDFWKKAAGLEAPIETPEEVAQMLDDGVKRNRKQVQVFDPFADFAELEQRKEDKKAQKVREEKEEKERARLERKKRKILDKEKKRKERDDVRGSLFGKSKTPPPTIEDDDDDTLPPKKQPKEQKMKKPKKSSDRKRAMRRAQNADPVLERLKQAWDVPQRNRALAACLRIGFPRFSKIRNESNLTSLPIQDIEVFFRSYFFQLTLQSAVAFMQMLRGDTSVFSAGDIKVFLRECLGFTNVKELNWLCDCLSSAMKHYFEVESQRRFLRLPAVLAEASFMTDLRRGGGLRSLRRIFLLSRVGRIVEDELDDILAELGYEQLGKRGCQTSNFSSMDADLKARLAGTEELSLALGSHLRHVHLPAPVAWWDRSCDIALVIGTFVHGLGNYEAMQNDDALPFSFRIRQFAKADEACASAQKRFYDAAAAARRVFHDALEAAKIKDQLQIQAAVAAAAAASTEREKDALALREGGVAAGAASNSIQETPADKLYEIDGDDSHFVTLLRLKTELCSANPDQPPPGAEMEVDSPADATSNDDGTGGEEKSNKRKGSSQLALTMPDARILDYRLNFVLADIERQLYPDEADPLEEDPKSTECAPMWPSSKAVSESNLVCSRAASKLVDMTGDEEKRHSEYNGIGFSGTQCGSSHRSLDDGSDYCIGAASADLAQVAYGSDAPRYLRAIGVPMNLTRYAVAAIIHADTRCIEQFLENEKTRNLAGDATPKEAKEDVKEVTVKREEDSATTVPTEGAPVEQPSNQPNAGDGADSKCEDDKKAPEPEPVTSLSKQYPAVPSTFAENAALRASVCAVVLYCGFPFKPETEHVVHKSLWRSIREQCGTFDDVLPDSLFQPDRFVQLVDEISGDIEIPPFDAIRQYVEGCLLPHCLRVCLMGNGPTFDNARGSKGEYDTAYGICLYPEPTENMQCSLPDPCLSLGEHSVEAVASSFAVLRRAQLMRSVLELASGKVSMSHLDDVFHSSFMRKSMAGLPVWWCPWIHDAALLVHASTRGLFSILKDRKSDDGSSLAFSERTIVQHMYSTFVADDSNLPGTLADESSPEDSQVWIEHHAKTFPTMNVLERRLAFLCARATESLEGEGRYDSLPMFDHGAWPRN